MLDFKVKKFFELSLQELYQLLELRSEVFVVEQNCVYQDVDGKDQKALHVLGYHKEELVAYTRIFDAGDYFDTISFGRVVVSPNARSKGFGHILLKETLHAIESSFNKGPITISAQTYLKAFYELYGFKQKGESYLEDGIPHIEMIKD